MELNLSPEQALQFAILVLFIIAVLISGKNKHRGDE